ncbi:MAG: hypothetical protein U0572_14930 [Phycisphaerales bacterium]
MIDDAARDALDSSDAWNAAMHAALDDALGDDERARLGAALAADPALARQFARLAMLHDAISLEMTAGQVGRGFARSGSRMLLARRVAVAAAIVLASTFALWFTFTGTSASAAAELARIVAASSGRDRMYVVRAIDDDAPGGRSPRANGRDRRGAEIDGATVALRGANQYVLTRAAADGGRVVTGSDGHVAWIVPVDGPVRVSRDPLRFRGALPGSRHDLPFVDPREGLDALARTYDLAIVAPADDREHRHIVATRRPDARGGPKRVELVYDPASALVLRMRFEHLPQAQGGPRSVEFELLSDEPLDASFFAHEFHHASDRPVIFED